MEGTVSPELAQTPEPESSQDLDSSSQAPAAVPEEEKGDGKQGDATCEDQVEGTKKTAKTASELKKTWRFRRTTIAKRDMAGEMAGVAAIPEAHGAPVRRSSRQSKRTDKLEEFLVAVKRGRGGGRRSAPAQLEIGDPFSETASEASFDGNSESKAESKPASPLRRTRGRGRGKQFYSTKAGTADSASDDGSSENEEARNEPQEKADVEPGAEDGEEESAEVKQEDAEKEDVEKLESNEEAPAPKRPSRSPVKAGFKRESMHQAGPRTNKEEDKDESSSSGSDDDGYDPNALYCICRQKHNKRFMICCDRCEEWFHGDCVGITETRGRLMERNSEDYVCPNCMGKKTQSPKSSTAGPELRPALSTAAHKMEPSSAAGSQAITPATTTALEEKAGDELGIKGRIEKAANPSGKRKIKIFQPQVMAAAEGSTVPKCIGPGCERGALPGSVYCGNDCILKHAAAAMKTITTDSKESKPKEAVKPKAQKKVAAKSTPKTSGPERRSTRRSTESSSKAQEDSSDVEGHEEDEDEEDKVAVEHPPPPAMSSWSSDHNYIAVAPEKTTPISPSVLNKACMYLKGFPQFTELSLCDLYGRTDVRNGIWPTIVRDLNSVNVKPCICPEDIKIAGPLRCRHV